MITSMHRAFVIFAVTAFALVSGCSSTPDTAAEHTEARNEAQAALNKFKATDPSLDTVLSSAAGYAIFPTVGSGGLIIAGAHGEGTVYEAGGSAIGYAKITEASIGLTAGGQAYSELIVFESPESLTKFKNNEFTFSADATAVAADKGAAANAKFDKGVAIFTKTEGGLMASAAIGGQKFKFTPMSEAMKSDEMK